MKTLSTLFTLIVALLFNINKTLAQNSTSDSLRRVQLEKQVTLSPKEQKNKQLNYYRRSLQVDSLKADQVFKIQADYKAGMKTLEADQSMNLENRRARIKELMEEKNSKLEKILDVGQQAKIIPPGESRRSKGTTKINQDDNNK